MPSITLSLPTSGTVITAGLHANNYTSLQNLLNGGLDTANWATGKIFAPSKLMQESATAGQHLQWDNSAGIWKPSVGYGTALPGSPFDGQEFTLVDSTSAPTYDWRLRFNAADGKWRFIGGSPGFKDVQASETTTSTTYAALTTAGPSFALPVAGDYIVAIGCFMDQTGANTDSMSYDIGGTGAVDGDRCFQGFGSGGHNANEALKTGLTAVTLTAKYKVSAGTGTFAKRWMRVIPVRLG